MKGLWILHGMVMALGLPFFKRQLTSSCVPLSSSPISPFIHYLLFFFFSIVTNDITGLCTAILRSGNVLPTWGESNSRSHPILFRKTDLLSSWTENIYLVWQYWGTSHIAIYICFGWEHVLRRSLSSHDTQWHILLNGYYDSCCYLKFLMRSIVICGICILNCRIVCSFWKTSMLFHVMGMLEIDLSNNALDMLKEHAWQN